MSTLTEREANILEVIKHQLSRELQRLSPDHFSLGHDTLCGMLADFGLVQRDVQPKTTDLSITRYYVYRRIDTPPKET